MTNSYDHREDLRWEEEGAKQGFEPAKKEKKIHRFIFGFSSSKQLNRRIQSNHEVLRRILRSNLRLNSGKTPKTSSFLFQNYIEGSFEKLNGELK